MENIQKNFFEHQAWAKDETVLGVDEAGRGCLAGPIVAAAAIIARGAENDLVKDSKLLSAEQRFLAFQWVIKNSVWGIGIVNNRLIDRRNIYEATKIAMKRAISECLSQASEQPAAIIIDAVPLNIPGFTGTIHSFPRAESASISVAAASIIAKVTRDTLMDALAKDFPAYAFADHKGYGTPTHQQHITAHAPSILHRTSFITVPTCIQHTIPF